MAGRVVSSYEQGEQGCDKAANLKGFKAFISKETPEGSTGFLAERICICIGCSVVQRVSRTFQILHELIE